MSGKLLALLLIQEMPEWEGLPKINPEIHWVLGRWWLVRLRQAHNKEWLTHIKSIISLHLEGGKQNFHPCARASSASLQPLPPVLLLTAPGCGPAGPQRKAVSTAFLTNQAAFAQGLFRRDLRPGQDPWLRLQTVHTASHSAKHATSPFKRHPDSTLSYQRLTRHRHRWPSSLTWTLNSIRFHASSGQIIFLQTWNLSLSALNQLNRINSYSFFTAEEDNGPCQLTEYVKMALRGESGCFKHKQMSCLR